jgi:predicted transcriptional regulator
VPEVPVVGEVKAEQVATEEVAATKRKTAETAASVVEVELVAVEARVAVALVDRRSDFSQTAR